MPPAHTRTFTYRETVSMAVPEGWVVQESEDRCLLCDMATGAARVRLSIGQHEAEDRSLEDLIEALFFGEPSERIGDNLRMRFQVEPGWENGQDVLAYSWTVAVPVDGRRVRTAEFSYHVAAGREADPETVSELEYIDRMIRDAQYEGVGRGSGS